MIEKTLQFFALVVSMLLGILAANKYNIVDKLQLVSEEYAYEIGITFYSAVIDFIVIILLNKLLKAIENKFLSKLEVVISPQGACICVGTDAFLEFNNQDLTEANVLVKIKGVRKHFNNNGLIIRKPAFAEIQSNYRRNEVTVTPDSYCIKLESLFGGSNTIDCSHTFKIVMIQDPVDGDTSVVIYPELSKKSFGLIYKHNNAHLKAVRR